MITPTTQDTVGRHRANELRLPGILITFDGPGGVGKSTVADLVATAMDERAIPSRATVEPTRTPLGEHIRASTETYRGMALACLVAADRHHHLATEILPALRAGRVVVCDRYLPSSLVLQRLDGMEPTIVWQLNAGVYVPDLAVLLNAEPAVIADRLRRRGAHSRFRAATRQQTRRVRPLPPRRSPAALCRLAGDGSRLHASSA